MASETSLYSAEDEAFREEVRAFVKAHVPLEVARRNQRGYHCIRPDVVQWMRALHTRGWSVPNWPVEYGGPGWTIRQRHIFEEESFRLGAPEISPQGHTLVGPIIYEFGSAEMKDRFLPGIRSGDQLWAQGFSEPNAGSDLASLQTRALRDGDNYVVNGQKVWTSWARESRWCMALVRTDPEASKHKGISCLVIDMETPGIEVRPIRQAWGPSDFCELFFDDVVVPVENRIGDENDGWAVAQGTLAAERAITILDMTERLRRRGIGAAVEQAAGFQLEDGSKAIDDPAVREMLAECLAESEVLRHLLNGMIDDIVRGADVSGTSSIIKVFYSELLHKLTRQFTDVLGARGQLDGPVLASAGWETDFWMNDYIHSFGWLIGGGTSEIMRNVIGERMLGLPR
jgi:alkylation response protein AidB-like acyl-CoA dehydrogenase